MKTRALTSSLAMAVQSLKGNKLRTLLTLLGTIIGVTCVVALWNVGESARAYMNEEVVSLGKNLILVVPLYNTDPETQRRERYRPLKLKDVEAVSKYCPSVETLSPVVQYRVRAVYGTRFRQTIFCGCHDDLFKIRNWRVARGALFNGADQMTGQKVVVLGQGLADELFEKEDPLGKRVRMDNVAFTVVGILESQEGGPFGSGDEGFGAYGPFRSVASPFAGADPPVHAVFASASTGAAIPRAKVEILETLRKAHGLEPGRKDNVELRDLRRRQRCCTCSSGRF